MGRVYREHRFAPSARFANRPARFASHTRLRRPHKRNAIAALHVTSERPRLEGVVSVTPACSHARGTAQLWAWRHRQHRACIALVWSGLVSATCEGCFWTMFTLSCRSRRLLWSMMCQDTILRRDDLAFAGRVRSAVAVRMARRIMLTNRC